MTPFRIALLTALLVVGRGIAAQPLELRMAPAHPSRIVMREILNFDTFEIEAETRSQVYEFPATEGMTGDAAHERDHAMIVVDGVLHGVEATLNLGVYREGVLSPSGSRYLKHPDYGMIFDRSATFRAEYYVEGPVGAVVLGNSGPDDIEILALMRVEGIRAAAPTYDGADAADLPPEHARPEIFAFMPEGELPQGRPEAIELYRGKLALTKDMFSRNISLPAGRPIVGLLAQTSAESRAARVSLVLNSNRMPPSKPRGLAPGKAAAWVWDDHAEWIRLRAEDGHTVVQRLVAYRGDSLGHADRPSYAEFEHPKATRDYEAQDGDIYTETARIEQGEFSRTFSIATNRTRLHVNAAVRADREPARLHIVFDGESWEDNPGAMVRAFAAVSTTRIPDGADSFRLYAADADLLVDAVAVAYDPADRP